MPYTRTHLTATDVAFRLPDGRPLFSAVTLGLGNEIVGLIGPNGSGKSTLLSVLAGSTSPSSGQVQRFATRIGFVRQGARVSSDATIASVLQVRDKLDAIARAERGVASPEDLERIGADWDLPDRVRAAMNDIGLGHLALDRPMSSLSGGESKRVSLASQVLAHPDVLLLDEPTNDLDAPSRLAVRTLLSQWRGGLLVATHDREVLSRVDRILAFEHGTLVAYGGAWDVYVEERERQRAAAERERDSAHADVVRARRDAQIVRERQAKREAAGRKSRERGGIPKILLNARVGQSQATTARLSRTASRVVETAEQRLSAARARAAAHDPLAIRVSSTNLPARAVVCDMRDVTVGAGGSPLLCHVNFSVIGPERVAIVGPNGSGKTSLLRVLMGHAAPLSGEVYRGVPAARFAYLDQHVSLLNRAETVRDVFAAHHPDLDVTGIRAALARFHFRADAALQPVGTLSGGERMRAALACVLAGDAPPQCLVLDEPTNHLDLDSLEAVESALRGYDGALVVVSHDTAFLDAINVARSEDVTRWSVHDDTAM